MRLAVLDVGSNTIRLLVASVEQGGAIVPVEKEKVRLGLGEEIERYGSVSDVHVAAAAKAVRRLAETARSRGAESLDVFVTAPGRQSGNAAELVAALTRAAGVPARVLSTDEEGRLAYGGAVATATLTLPGRIAVCDVGGASTEVAVGSPRTDPEWVRSVDLGSVRLTTRVVAGERVTRGELREAYGEVAQAFAGVQPPPVEAGLAVGGSARAARRLVGPELGEAELAEALQLVASKHPRAISRRFGVDRARAHILPGGLVLLAEVQRRLGVPLQVCDGGIREGALLAAVATRAA
jgi:exopolyphosphatase / guanosine-5'-triphosphate,3'-diphosphate pyrophosphatase